MTLAIIEPGAQATVQDLGRTGHAHEGVPRSGAADTLSLVLANRVAGNPDGAAVLEITMSPLVARFDRDATVAIAGGPAPLEVRIVRSGEEIRVEPRHARAYLAVAGGIDTSLVMGSRSTLLAAGLGGQHGRALRGGDVLPLGTAVHPPREPPAAVSAVLGLAQASRVLRVVPAAASRDDALWRRLWLVEARSDRVGVRMRADAADASDRSRADSRGMPAAAIQAPSERELIVLGPDGPTTGGYPVPGVVCAVDMPSVGQFAAGDRVRLQPIERAVALAIYRERWRTLDALLSPIAK
ncbi:MAG: biotin-dependent carboxyltransferase family protein [Planctomycetota bacterium]